MPSFRPAARSSNASGKVATAKKFIEQCRYRTRATTAAPWPYASALTTAITCVPDFAAASAQALALLINAPTSISAQVRGATMPSNVASGAMLGASILR